MVRSNIYFISDLHLCETRPKTADCFLNFLNTIANDAKALYILGDFFEVWIGDDDRNPFNEKIKTALHQYTRQGIPTYLMHGNRDFLIRKRFAKETGVTLLKEPTTISINGEPVLLLHGDSLCTLDERHQKSRKIMHNRLYQSLVLLLPLKIRQHYGNHFRSASHQRKSTMSDSIMDVTPDEVIRVMQDEKVNTLIHGHTHRPAIHDFEINKKTAKRIVLGAWHDNITYCRVDDAGKFELV